MIAQTSPAKLRLHAVLVMYSVGLRRYVSIMKLRYAKKISGVFDLFFPLKNSGRARFSTVWIEL